ncbi:glycoside hydrolase family protein [Neisseria brasiliensis]|uniref:lysozyme n=1 Tax=Neisseria TaxID=482 RepID=UPI000C27B35A|nr:MULTISPECIES: lysozyme [Neisseria]PJO78750.1 lysozyme [Neisseria sp. N177_16]QGL24204.1 glycoside hydrolase family protein [Neisseria brasiliensis]
MQTNPNQHKHIDDAGYQFIAKWEGKRNAAYLDSVRIPTIGIGFIRYTIGARAGRRVKLGDVLLDSEIQAEFTNQIKTYEDGVKAVVTVPLTQSQFNACVSLCYNIGVAAFARSTVVRRLNERKYQAACAAFALWNKAGGRVIKGLSNRRTAEQKEFFRHG